MNHAPCPVEEEWEKDELSPLLTRDHGAWGGNKLLLPHVAVRCRPLTAEEYRVCAVRGCQPQPSPPVSGSNAPPRVTYPVSFQVTLPSDAGGHVNGTGITLARYMPDGTLRMLKFPRVFDAVFLPQSVECFARLRHEWERPNAAGAAVPEQRMPCYDTLLDMSTVPGDEAAFAAQMIKNVVTQVTGGAPAWVDRNKGEAGDGDDDKAEEAALKREVEQLAYLNSLCSYHPAMEGKSAFAGDSVRPHRRRNFMLEQEDVADQPIVPLLTGGRHVTVVAFGPPQSGKSYTLFGSPQSADTASDREWGCTELPSFASTHTHGLISHVLRELLDFTQRRQKQRRKTATVDAWRKKHARQIKDDHRVQAAFVAFQDDPLTGLSPSDHVPSVFMYDLWNPSSFAALRRTVRLFGSTANLGVAGHEDGVKEKNVRGTANHSGHPDVTKCFPADEEGGAFSSLLVEGAVWMDVHAEDTMVAYQQHGLEHLTLLREKLHVLGVHAPLHVALLLRAQLIGREECNIILDEIMAGNDGPPPVYHAEGVFIELQWTPAVASGSAFRSALQVPEAAAASAFDADPPNTLSLFLKNVRRGHAKLFLIPTIRPSLLHATDTMNALKTAVACKLLCRHRQRLFVPCTLDPVEATRGELANVETALCNAKTHFSTTADADQQRLHILSSFVQQLTVTVAERHSLERQLVLSWQHADRTSREALVRAWATPSKKQWHLFALCDTRRKECSATLYAEEDVGAGLRRHPVYFLLLLPPPSTTTWCGQRFTPLAAKHGAMLEYLRDSGPAKTLFPLFFDLRKNDLGDRSPVELSLRMRFAPDTLVSPVMQEGVVQLPFPSDVIRSGEEAVRGAAVEVCVRAVGSQFFIAAYLWQSGQLRTDAVPAVYVNGGPVLWRSPKKARPFATAQPSTPLWVPLTLGARLVVGPYVFILSVRDDTMSFKAPSSAVVVVAEAEQLFRAMVALRESRCRCEALEWHQQQLGTLSGAPPLDERRELLQRRWKAVERGVVAAYHQTLQKCGVVWRHLMWGQTKDKKGGTQNKLVPSHEVLFLSQWMSAALPNNTCNARLGTLNQQLKLLLAYVSRHGAPNNAGTKRVLATAPFLSSGAYSGTSPLERRQEQEGGDGDGASLMAALYVRSWEEIAAGLAVSTHVPQHATNNVVDPLWLQMPRPVDAGLGGGGCLSAGKVFRSLKHQPSVEELRLENDSLDEYLEQQLNAKPQVCMGARATQREGTRQKVELSTQSGAARFVYPNDAETLQRLFGCRGRYARLLRPSASMPSLVAALLGWPDDGGVGGSQSKKRKKNDTPAEGTAALNAVPSPWHPTLSSYLLPQPENLTEARVLQRFIVPHIDADAARMSAGGVSLCHQRQLLLELLNFLAELEKARLWKSDGPTVPSHRLEYKHLMRGEGPSFRMTMHQRQLAVTVKQENSDAAFNAAFKQKWWGEDAAAPCQMIHNLCSVAHVHRLKHLNTGLFFGKKTTIFVPTTVVIHGHFLYYYTFAGREPHPETKAKGGCYLLGATIVGVSRSLLEKRRETGQSDAKELLMAASAGKGVSGNTGNFSSCSRAVAGVDGTSSGSELLYFIEIVPSVGRGVGKNHLFDTRENHLILGFGNKGQWKQWKTWLNTASMPVLSPRLKRYFGSERIEDAAIQMYNDLQRSRLHQKGWNIWPWRGGGYHAKDGPIPLTLIELKRVLLVTANMALHHTYTQVTDAALSSLSASLPVAVAETVVEADLLDVASVNGKDNTSPRRRRERSPFEAAQGFPASFLHQWSVHELAEHDLGLQRAVMCLFEADSRACQLLQSYSFPSSTGAAASGGGGGGGDQCHALPHSLLLGALALPTVVLPLSDVPFATQLRTAFVTHVHWSHKDKSATRAHSASAAHLRCRGRWGEEKSLFRRGSETHILPWQTQSEEAEVYDGGADPAQESAPIPFTPPFRQAKLIDVHRLHKERYTTHVWFIDHFKSTIECATSAPAEEDPHLRRRGYIRSAMYQSYELLHVARSDACPGKTKAHERKSKHSAVTLVSRPVYGVTIVFYRTQCIVYNDYFVDMRERERFMECVAALRPTVRVFAPALTAVVVSKEDVEDSTLKASSPKPHGVRRPSCLEEVSLRAVMPTSSPASAALFWSAVLQHLHEDGVMTSTTGTRQHQQWLQRQSNSHGVSWNVMVDARLANSSEYMAKRVQGLSPFASGEAVKAGEERKTTTRRLQDYQAALPCTPASGLHQEAKEGTERFTVRLEGVCGLHLSGEATVPLTVWTGTINLDGMPMENPASLREWLDTLAPHWSMDHASGGEKTTVHHVKEEGVDDNGNEKSLRGSGAERLGRKGRHQCGETSASTRANVEHGRDGACPQPDKKKLPSRMLFDIVALTAQEVSFYPTPDNYIAYAQEWFEQQSYVPIAVASLNTAVVLLVFARRHVACLCGAVRTRLIPLTFTALNGKHGAVLVSVEVGQSPVCFLAVHFPAMASHTTLSPLVLATYCAFIEEVLTLIPGGAHGSLLQLASISNAGADHSGKTTANGGAEAEGPVQELRTLRRQTSTVDGLEFYDHVFLMGHWGTPLLLDSLQPEPRRAAAAPSVGMGARRTEEGTSCGGSSSFLVEFFKRMRCALAEEGGKKHKGNGIVGKAPGKQKESHERLSRGSLPVIHELMRGHDVLTALRANALLLSRGCGVLEPLPLFTPSFSVEPGTMRYTLQFLSNAAEAEAADKDRKGKHLNETKKAVVADGVFLAYPSRVLYKQRPNRRLHHWQVTPRAYGSVPLLFPGFPRVVKLREAYAHMAPRCPQQAVKLPRKRECNALKQVENILLSAYLPVSAVFSLHVLRPSLGGVLWGREAAAQPGKTQSWWLRLRRLAMQLPEHCDTATPPTREGRHLAIVVQFVPFLASPIVIIARERAPVDGVTAVLLYRQTKSCMHPVKATPQSAPRCIIGDYAVEPPLPLTSSPPSPCPSSYPNAAVGAALKPLAGEAAGAVAEIELLPHHAVVLAHARMLISIFDCSASVEKGDKGEAHLVGSATLPIIDIILASVEQCDSRHSSGVTQRMKGGTTVVQNVELPPLELPLHRCGQRVGTLCIACSPLMCIANVPVEGDLL
ncbi:hypothetical protein TraAM80_01801 [Trypanosoma rangeli]|uniref:Uncharacterized protein n=1 Tax=Trypanosoma rangeli TaxID=5698 RepID=A0A3R7MR86_TRYRA|nr:uncharacterized protein TraAM80_01801 [Trypanosoma rangeli]RNF09962.1 hypothetical protein TraAM80_01801 [Trypanosoma rangeli]|eukprot:RNF09962.1 hypothetical protein TraAM80_01801 [Trypanosoma rangeli]